MKRVRRQPALRIEPAVVSPGGTLRVDVSKIPKGESSHTFSVQLVSQVGDVVAEAALVLGKRHYRARLEVPFTTSTGPHDVVLRGQDSNWRIGGAYLLSKKALKRMKYIFLATEKREEAYRLAASKHFDKALTYLATAASRFHREGLVNLEAEVLLEQATVLQQAKRPDEVQPVLRAAMTTFGRAAFASRQDAAYGKAWLYFSKALDIALKLHDHRNVIVHRNNVGEALLYLGSWRAAQRHLTLSLKGTSDLKDPLVEAKIRKNLGVAYIMQHQFGQAREEFMKAEKFFDIAHAKERLEEVRRQLAALQTVSEGGSLSDVHLQPRPLDRDP